VGQGAPPQPTTLLPGAFDASSDSSFPYPVETAQPSDEVPLGLLKQLAKEAAIVAVCELESLDDLYNQPKDIYHLFVVGCRDPITWVGPKQTGRLRFLWQVEKGSRVPAPHSKLLVLLTQRRDVGSAPQGVNWVALDIGVFRFSEGALQRLESVLSRKTLGAKR